MVTRSCFLERDIAAEFFLFSFFFFGRCTEALLRSTGQVPTDKYEQNPIFLSDLTLTVPVQTLLCLLELSVDVPELVLNQRLLHVEHRVHYLQPNSGGEGQGRDVILSSRSVCTEILF